MNILFFIDDINSSSGVNYDIKVAKINLEKYTSHKVFLVSHNDFYDESNNDILKLGNINFIKKCLKFKKFVCNNNIKIAHIRGVGLGSINHIHSFLLCYLSNLKPIVTTFSQINKYALDNKIFFENPDVKLMSFKKNKHNFRLSIINFLSSNFTPFFKKVLFYLVSKHFLKKSSCLIFFSQFEKNQVGKLLDLVKINYSVIPEPILDFQKFKMIKSKFSEKKSFYDTYWEKNTYVNIIYWGRIDFKNKGLDNIVKVFNRFVEKYPKTKIRIHFMGPDYNNGLNKLKSLISGYNLDKLMIIHSHKVWKNNLKPFLDADFSILSSRVDGFPRSLRESLIFEVPIICSVESNFSDIISDFNCGYSFISDVELFKVYEKIENEEYSISELKMNCKIAISEFLNEKNITQKISLLYESQFR